MIKIRQHGNFDKTDRFLNGQKKINAIRILEGYGWEGVHALTIATPKDTGLTADSWEYTIEVTKTSCKLSWVNTNVKDGIPIAILIQYGHATRSGSYIQGIDYINPAIRPIFNKISENLWAEVSNL